jgi:hypothetical protein
MSCCSNTAATGNVRRSGHDVSLRACVAVVTVGVTLGKQVFQSSCAASAKEIPCLSRFTRSLTASGQRAMPRLEATALSRLSTVHSRQPAIVAAASK